MTTIQRASRIVLTVFGWSFAAFVNATSLPVPEGSTDADVSIVVSDGAVAIAPGGTVSWSILVSNLGPDTTLAQVHDTFPNGVTGVTWTCTPTGPAICSASGNANISDVVYLPTGESLTYTATGQITAAHGSTITNTGLVGTLNGVVDSVVSNNVSSDSFVVEFPNPPKVLQLNAAANPRGCTLFDGVESAEAITQVVFDFDQPMANPIGDASVIDITNPANYLLVEAGPDALLQTTSCAGAPQGDDQIRAIRAISVDNANQRVSLAVDHAGNHSLPKGQYRVLGCATGLRSDLGRLLDGDGDATAGDDFHSDFRVLETNLIPNPNFDQSSEFHWTLSGPPVILDGADADQIPWSWSIRRALDNMGLSSRLQYCAPITESGYYQAGYRTNFDGMSSSIRMLLVKSAGVTCGFTTGLFSTFFGENGRVESPLMQVTPSEAAGGASILVEIFLNQGNSVDSAWLRKVTDRILRSNFDAGVCAK